MADLTAIRAALATQITAHTGLSASGDAPDLINPPCAIVLPGAPLMTYGQTMDGAAGMNLAVIILMTNGAPTDATQRALDAYLGIGTGETASVAAAIMADPSLGGLAHWAEPMTLTNYGRITWNGLVYFGARLNVNCGVM